MPMEKSLKNGWIEFFVSERERLQNYVRGKVQKISRMDAEDIVAEVMLSVLARADNAGGVENLAAYVYRSVRNKIVDYQRAGEKTVSLQELSRDDDSPFSIDYFVDASADVAGEAERKERMRRLAEAIDRLEPKQRAVFLATELDKKTFQQLSEEWREPMGTLLSRKCRAMKNLREMLKDLND